VEVAGESHGRWPRAVRSGFLAVAIFALVVFALSIPSYVSQLGDVCIGPPCSADQLSPQSADAIEQFGGSVSLYATLYGGLTIAAALFWFGTATVIYWSKPNDPFVSLVALTLVLAGAFTVTGSVFVENSLLASAIQVLNNLELVCFLLFLALFPDGQFMPRWTRWLVVGAAALAIGWTVIPRLEVLGPIWFVMAGTLLGAQVFRFRRVSSIAQRQQTKWVLFSFVLVVAVVLGMFLVTEILSLERSAEAARDVILAPLATVALLLVPLSIGLSILRYHLFSIDAIINRTLVYGALTLCVVAIYVVVVGYLGALFRTDDNLPVSLLASGLVAILFAPLRDRLQRGVNRLMYGDRDDPYAVLSNLGRQLEATLAPDAVLPVIVTAVKERLRLPYAAISLDNDLSPAAEAGGPAATLERVPLMYHNEPVGTLLLTPRVGEESFALPDRRLLEDLARQIGVAVHAVRLTTDLQRARERLVTAREEERRRLRRDLHDGLGPQLSGQALTIDAIRVVMRDDPKRAEALLLDLKTQAQDAVTDIRQLVDELRPPALDELGLLGALRTSVARFGQSGPVISFVVPDWLPELPAAVEVALYHISREGMINALRHAAAKEVVVTLALHDADSVLRLEIRDDGRGFLDPSEGDPPRTGVGISSMRERAEELGGQFTITPGPGQGTVIRADLPIAPERT